VGISRRTTATRAERSYRVLNAREHSRNRDHECRG